MPDAFQRSKQTPREGRFSWAHALSWLGAGLLFAGWLTTEHFLPWVSWHAEVMAFLAVFWLAWWSLCVRPGAASSRLDVPGAILPLMFLGLVIVVQAAVGTITFAGDALVMGLYLVLSAAALMMGFAWGRAQAAPKHPGPAAAGPNLPYALAITLLAGALVSAAVAFAQVFDVWEGAGWIVRMPQLRRPGANLAQPNQLATLLLMGVASLLYLHAGGKLSGWAAGWIFFVLSAAVAATESRTGALSFAVLAAWCLVGRARAGLPLSPWTILIAGIGFFGLFWGWPLLMSASDVFAPDAQVNVRAGLRLVVWPQLLEAVALRPWGGWGLREVSQAHNAVVSAHAASEPFTYSHNLVIDLALGMGLPLTALLVLATAVWLGRRVRSSRSLLPWYCLAGMLPVAVHSMLEFPFAYAYFLAPVMLLLGVLEATSGARPILKVRAGSAAAALLVATVAGAWSVVEYLRIEEDFRVARFEALRIGQTPASHERPKVHLLTQLGALLDGARIVPHAGMSAEEIGLARKVALRYPWPATQNRYALSLALNGHPDEALRQMRVMRAMHGEKTYAEIKFNWEALAKQKHPQLGRLTLP